VVAAARERTRRKSSGRAPLPIATAGMLWIRVRAAVLVGGGGREKGGKRCVVVGED